MNKTNNFYPGTLQQNQAQYEPIRLARSCGGQSVLLQHVSTIKLSLLFLLFLTFLWLFLHD